MNKLKAYSITGAGALSLIVLVALPADADLATPTCPQTSSTTSFQNGTLTTDCATPTSHDCTTKAGVVANGTILQLQNNGASFQTTSISTLAAVSFAAVGDFNHDGWPDFIGSPVGASAAPLKIYQNQTWQNEGCATSACAVYSPPPNWSLAIAPKFIDAENLHSGTNPTSDAQTKGWYSLAAGDFNGDGWDDAFEMFAPDLGLGDGIYSRLYVYLNKAGNTGTGCTNAPVGGCPQFFNGYNAATNLTGSVAMNGTTLTMPFLSTNIQSGDFNNDGHLDVLVGTGENGTTIHLFTSMCTLTVPHVDHNGLHQCSDQPQFYDGGILLDHINTQGATAIADAYHTNTTGSVPVFYYADYDGDGLKDLIVGGTDCCNLGTEANYRLRLYKGCPTPDGTTCSASHLEMVASQHLNGTSAGTPFPGHATAVLVADFTLDGKPDVIVGTDNAQNSALMLGGQSYIWANTGTTSPFSVNSSAQPTYSTQTSFRCATNTCTAAEILASKSTDYDVGIVFDYDKDPQHTPDVMLADGNNTGAYYVLADRTAATFVSCGDVVSGTLDLGAVSGTDAVITSARITPNFTTNGGTVNFFMSNEPDPSPTWVAAALCPLSATDYCASFPKPVGQVVRWKATLCSTGPTFTNTPTVTSVSMKYTFTSAAEHYRSGVIVNDGIAYVGAVREPADRGKFYAVNAGLTLAPYWEFGQKLDAMSDTARNIYTQVSGASFALTHSAALGSTPLKTLLGTPTVATSATVVDWIRGARFGLGSSTSPTTRLGAVITSSPAVLSKPGLPSWYAYATTTERTLVDTFVSANANRVQLSLFGAKDGMVHAAYSITSNVSGNNYPTNDARNGSEAWAYIPPSVLANMYADYSTSLTNNAAATDGEQHNVANYYPDGSPTLADYNAGGTMKTVALVAEGNGGRNFSAIDVTSTVNPSTNAVSGPTPLWNATPGGPLAGYAFGKPILARVQIAGVEKFIVVSGTGIDPADPTFVSKGRVVSAYDLATGTNLWQFQAKCTVTSNITAFETDDTLETPVPVLDGYIDRIVFADGCGYVYKLDPGVDLSATAPNNYLANTGMGTIAANTAPNGALEKALFQTHSAAATLNADRVIAGTISASIDNTTRMVLYFGTGGIESQPVSLQNAFYAIYADTGAVRSAFVPPCVASVCEKFYGGVVVTPTQVLFTRTVDPAIATNTCDVGTSTIQGYELNASAGSFVTDFSQAIGGAVQGALYGDAGALYFASMSGDVTRIGTPRATYAGDDTVAGHLQGTGQGANGNTSTGSSTNAFTLMGWRTVL